MTDCYKCPIKENLKYCCWCHPETRETVDLLLGGGRIVGACPELNNSGLCSIYEERPDACKGFIECPRMLKQDLVDLFD